MRWTYVLGGYGALVIGSATYEAVSGNWKPVTVSAVVIIVNLILVVLTMRSSMKTLYARMAWREAYWEQQVELVEKRAARQAVTKMLIRSRFN